jgi:hypothetical protein
MGKTATIIYGIGSTSAADRRRLCAGGVGAQGEKPLNLLPIPRNDPSKQDWENDERENEAPERSASSNISSWADGGP